MVIEQIQYVSDDVKVQNGHWTMGIYAQNIHYPTTSTIFFLQSWGRVGLDLVLHYVASVNMILCHLFYKLENCKIIFHHPISILPLLQTPFNLSN